MFQFLPYNHSIAAKHSTLCIFSLCVTVDLRASLMYERVVVFLIFAPFRSEQSNVKWHDTVCCC
jgi:hypothetical protein